MSKIEQKCCEMVRGAGRWGGLHKLPCPRAAKVIRDDKPFCGIHDPVAVKARRDKSSAKYEAKWNHERKQRNATAARAAAERAVVDAARKLGPWLKGSSLEREFPALCQRLRAALSALAALETPNDTKEST